VGNGDLLFYDWDNNGRMNHVSVVVAYGTSTDGFYGDMVDYHTNNRHKVFWTTRTYNTQIQTTYIYPIHIDPAN
jgi:hypothetical protein